MGRHVGIAMENPTYKRAYRIFESFAYRIHTVDMDDKGMRADRLSGLPVRVAYVMPSHQYPTGAVMTMPGLPKAPAAYNIDVDDSGRIVGLF